MTFGEANALEISPRVLYDSYCTMYLLQKQFAFLNLEIIKNIYFKVIFSLYLLYLILYFIFINRI